MSIRVFIAYNQKVIAEGVAAMLRTYAEIEVVGVCDSEGVNFDDITNLMPDVIVIGNSAVDQNGNYLSELIALHSESNNFVVISSGMSRVSISDVLKAGAKAHISLNSEIDDLIVAIRRAAVGACYLCENSVHELTRDVGVPLSGSVAIKRELGRREAQVLRLVAVGRTSKEIARNLDISPSTVEVHRRNIMRKLGLHKAADLTRFAIRHQMIVV